MCHWYIKALTPLSPISTYKFSRLISINILKFYTDDVSPVADPGEGPGGPPPLISRSGSGTGHYLYLDLGGE